MTNWLIPSHEVSRPRLSSSHQRHREDEQRRIAIRRLQDKDASVHIRSEVPFRAPQWRNPIGA